MSLASAARLQGLTALLATTGESLTYDESETQFLAIVNRAEEQNKQPQMPNFSAQDETKIELLKTAMGGVIPVAGGAFYDAFDHAYRVLTVKRGEHTYLCTCKGSDVAT